ncbi:helix-turn-helix domain-containing protein [Aquimarina agarilytica]|uniref:helix-turn-helix domain-containing protein n=1 Tax=Aquimarina agarilytica TaxID=1087449 RepID=UPI0002892D27|nr:AraC family transcriptional regulator [Aquimarina agarilytica]
MNLIIDFILVVGFTISIVILTLTFKSNQKKLTKKILGAIHAIALLYILNFYFELHNLEILSFFAYLFTGGLLLCLGPLLLFYTKSICTTKKRIEKSELIHFIPHLAYWTIITIPFFINTLNENDTFKHLAFLENYDIPYWFETLMSIGYIVFSIKLFSRYKSILKSNFSSLDLNNLKWSQFFLIGLLIVMLVDVSGSIVHLFIEIKWDTGFVTIISYISILTYLGYYGINNSNVLIPETLLSITNSGSEKKVSHEPRKCLIQNKEDYFVLEQKLNNILQTQKPYLDENLSLNSLANLVGTSDKKLSILLNQHLKTTFYDLINKKRVDAVKEKIKYGECEKLTILGVAHESGFKSKSSFNRIFKKETGQSPTEYKNAILNSSRLT